MKVKHLLQWTEWKPGKDYSSKAKPKLSILLPTFRRGRDGLFLRVVRNILGQCFSDIELIIIDDASTDGTSNIIEAIMREDGRVSCLTHKFNIGLPAVSEYEAYIKARGDFIGFGFDDFLFENSAFSAMMTAIENRRLHAAFGNVGLQLSANHQITLGNICLLDDLIFKNFIGNSSVFVHRRLIEDVGLYDPHVAVTRICDWDLWRRVIRRYEFKSTNVLIGRELGASRSDSLGNTYPMYPEIIQEFIDEDRDNLLVPGNFPERDIFTVPPNASIPLQSHIEVSRKFFENKHWYKNTNIYQGGACRKRISIFSGNYTRNQLVWGAFGTSKDNHVGWIESNPDTFHEKSSLLSSDIVLFSGNIDDDINKNPLGYCQRHRIPIAYFIDDYAPVLDWLPFDYQGVDTEHYAAADGQRNSNFEEILPGGRLKGWAYEKNSKCSNLIVSVDGNVVALIKADIERADLLNASIGNGNHAFFYDLPIEFNDGREHTIEIKFGSDQAHLRNSPFKTVLQPRTEVEAIRKSNAQLRVKNSLENLSNFDVIAAGSETIREAASRLFPDQEIHLVEPRICKTRL